jgi:hypothetical protein
MAKFRVKHALPAVHVPHRLYQPTLPPLPSLQAELPPGAAFINGQEIKDVRIEPADGDLRRRTARMVSGFRRSCPLWRLLKQCGKTGDNSSFGVLVQAAANPAVVSVTASS